MVASVYNIVLYYLHFGNISPHMNVRNRRNDIHIQVGRHARQLIRSIVQVGGRASQTHMHVQATHKHVQHKAPYPPPLCHSVKHITVVWKTRTLFHLLSHDISHTMKINTIQDERHICGIAASTQENL